MVPGCTGMRAHLAALGRRNDELCAIRNTAADRHRSQHEHRASIRRICSQCLRIAAVCCFSDLLLFPGSNPLSFLRDMRRDGGAQQRRSAQKQWAGWSGAEPARVGVARGVFARRMAAECQGEGAADAAAAPEMRTDPRCNVGSSRCSRRTAAADRAHRITSPASTPLPPTLDAQLRLQSRCRGSTTPVDLRLRCMTQIDADSEFDSPAHLTDSRAAT